MYCFKVPKTQSVWSREFVLENYLASNSRKLHKTTLISLLIPKA